MIRLISKIAIAIVLFSSGFVLHDYWYHRDILHHYRKTYHETREHGYHLISPLLECESSEEEEGNLEIRQFKHKVENYMNNHLDRKGASDISVYFRDLSNGPWFTINSEGKYMPSSLMKVPLMIVVLKQAESDPGFLKKVIRYKPKANEAELQNIEASKKLKAGSTYTVDELLFRTIVYSDNVSANVLQDTIEAERFGNLVSDLFLELGLADTFSKHDESYMTIEGYTSFFRILYNASYLNKEMSEKALYLLSQAEFKDGLVAGIPPEITVAHKFGVSVRGEKDDPVYQLHDCGIIYYPKNPYLLCVMTRGRKVEDIDDAIIDISRFIFREVDSHYKNH